MADQDMRLRLVVRRNGLPELRLMWHVKLDSNPSISKLLEQLNEHVPLESEDWGLEDYVVELRDSDGTDFECLHYQLVRSVLKPDDRVFIRALDQDDHRRRRISGRLQISSDGRHLIDGVPFGRPNLRTPVNRPPIRIPPRKRARLVYTQPDGDDQSRDNGSERDSPVLLLTSSEPQRDGRTPPRAQVAGNFDGDIDSDTEDSDYNEDDAESSSSSNESETEEVEEEVEKGTADGMEKDPTDEANEEDRGEAQDLLEEACDLAVENANLNGRELNSWPTSTISLETLDKVTVLRAAFPTVPINIFEKVLAASHNRLMKAYQFLSRGFHPQLSEEAVMTWKPGSPSKYSEQIRALTNSASTGEIHGEPSTKKRKFREQSPAGEPSNDGDQEEEHDNGLWRKYDHAGFPPGSITSGTGLKHMAVISASFSSSKTNGNSEATSTTLKAATEEPMDEDDDTSSSGTSSDSSDTSSSGNSSDSDDTSSSGDSSEDNENSDDASEEDSSSEDLSSQASTSDSDESDSENNDDSGGEPNRSTDKIARSQTNRPASDSGTSDNESDSGPEEYPFQTTSSPAAEEKEHKEPEESSDETSDSESDTSSSSDSEEDSEEDSDDEPNDIETLIIKEVATQTKSRAHPSSPKPAQANVAPVPVPPGAGKESTKRRNARRRAAKVAKREMQESNSTIGGTSTGDSHSFDSEAALFEAKRKALLDAIAAGGIEVGPSGKTAFDQSTTETEHVKQKRDEEGGISSQPDETQAAIEIDEHPGDNQDDQSPNQKRRRIDLGAGRRLVFGALGLQNPKNKEEEAKLRDKLQADSQLRVTRQFSSQPQPTVDEAVNIANEDGFDAWKLKINYRAVECCHENMELSPAPFPFQQRWDPQQQALSFSKRNKRGGQSKRAQRNQAHYYNDDSQLGKKRKRNDSYETADDGFDDTGNRQDEATNEDEVILNYDDVDSQNRDYGNNPVNETSQITDLDDLPSLPEDVSMLPVLRPGEARVGMVIAWQKWSCSSATSWQPQLSRVTALVVRVDDDAAALDVCLAKRDRYLDGNEKRYNHITGQRIYDKFEAPDLDEGEADDDHDDSGVKDGYRNVAWAEMQDPRILQEPLDPTVELDPGSNCLASVEMDEKSIGIENQMEPTVPNVSSQQDLEVITDPILTTKEGNVVDDISKPGASPEGRPGDSSVEPYVQAASNSTSHQAGQTQQTADSVMSDISQVSSPSRQLHETTSQAMGSHSPIQNWTRTSSIGQAESSQPSSPMPLPATVSSLLRLEEDFDSDLVTGTPDLLPRVIIPSSASSIRSGRQPDYAMAVDDDPFDATDEIDHRNDGHDDNNTPSERNSLTPIPICRTPTPDHNGTISEDKGKGRSPMATPVPRSPSSASSIFCTALTSHSTQSPSRVRMSSMASKSSTSRLARDAKYEEAMRKLDEQFSEDLSDDESTPLPPTSSLDVKFEDSTQFVPHTLEPISPPPRRRSSRPFTLPPGSQVVELSSDSEPVYTEDYADEDIDGTYSPELGSMPTGNGWVQKRRSTGRRSVS